MPPQTMRFQFAEQRRFHVFGIWHHLAIGNLLISRAMETQFADAKTAIRSDRRTKRTARHRSTVVKFAQSRLRIEHRTDLMISKVRETLFRRGTYGEYFLIEQAGLRITRKSARKSARKSLYRASRPLADSTRTLWISLPQNIHSVFQSLRVQAINREYTGTTLGASGAAYQPFSAAFGSVS